MRFRWFRLKLRQEAQQRALLGGGSGPSLSSVAAIAVVCLSVLYFGAVIVFSFVPQESLMLKAITPVTGWEASFSERVEELHLSIGARGSRFERAIFTALANLSLFSVHETALSYGAGTDLGGISWFTRLWMAGLNAVLHVAYLLLWWARFWLLLVGAGCIWRYLSFKPYEGTDILGKFSTGRMFFSGIRARFEKMDENGVPNVQAVSFCTLPLAPETAFENSELGRVLVKYQVANETNKWLARLLLHEKNFPAYLYEKGVAEDAVESGQVPSIGSFAAEMLGYVLNVHRRLGNQLAQVNEMPEGSWEKALELVVTRRMKDDLAVLPKEIVATSVLSLYAGRLLTFEQDTGMWRRVSNFPQRNARAVLHSVPHFGDEYSPSERQTIRRSLIYSSRQGIFSPIQFPLDLSPSDRALRQWTELLLANPKDLESAALVTELFALLSELDAEWRRHVSLAIAKNDVTFVDGIYAASDDTIYVPLRNLLSLCHRLLDEEKVAKIAALVERYHRENIDAVSSRDSYSVPALSLLSKSVVERVTKEQGVSEKELTDWAGLRCMLQYFGWLAHRVGNRTVNEASVVTCSLKAVDAFSGSSEPTFLRVAGLVPLRGARLKEIVGDRWESHLAEAMSVVIVGGAQDAPVADSQKENSVADSGANEGSSPTVAA